jgi:hypothetical protein
VENTLTTAKYSQLVDAKLISKDDELNCFRDPVDIFDFIVGNFNDVEV